MSPRRTIHEVQKRPNYSESRRQNPKLFESEQDRKNEAEYAAYICEKRNCKMFKLPMQWHLDYLVTNQSQQGVAWAEMKHRKVAHNAFPTFRISGLKFCRGIELAERFCLGMGKPQQSSEPMRFLIFVQWCDNKRMYYKYDSAHRDRLTIVWGGRTSKEAFRLDAANDVEAMVEIPMDLFTEI